MNLKYLEYLVAIVKHDFNITNAAESLYISQPALSNFIRRFEKDLNQKVFVREARNLTSLTQVGQILYKDSIDILNSYYQMMNKIEHSSNFAGGVFRIGINPIMLSALFTGIFNKISREHPNIQLEIIENPSKELLYLLDNNKLDMVFTLYPNDVDRKKYDEKIIYEETLIGFMNNSHPLVSKVNKETMTLSWKDIDKEQLAIFDENFFLRNYILSYYKDNSVRPNIVLESGSWDFLIENARHNDVITFMPSPVIDYANLNSLIYFNMDKPIPWKVSLVFPKKDAYSKIHHFVLDSLVDYFLIEKDIKHFRESSKTLSG